MKKNILSPIFLFLLGVLALTSCTKDNGPITKSILDDLENVPAVTTTRDASGSATLDLTDLSTFQGKFDVAYYFKPEDWQSTVDPVVKYDVVVRKNGSASNVKVFVAGATSIPASYTVTAAQIEALYGGEDIALGDTYDFSVTLYLSSGSVYDAFPQGGPGTAAGPGGYPGYSWFVRYAALCLYNPTLYSGEFEVLEDTWADYAPGDVIVLSQLNANTFTFLHDYAVDPLPVKCIVNTTTNTVKINRERIGSIWSWQTQGYTGATIETIGPDEDSYVSPCEETITLALRYGVDIGNYGGFPYFLILKKKH